MAWYRAGTVAITAGQNTVTGTGTSFSANARVGDAFLGPDGRWYEVTNIASGTVLSILPAYQGAAVSGGSYAITPVQGYTKTLADKFNDIANNWGSTLAGLGSVSTENLVPVAKGGTGSTTAAGARTALGLGTAAVATLQTSALDNTAGRLLAAGAFGLGGNTAVEASSPWNGCRFKAWDGAAADRPPAGGVAVGIDMGYAVNRRVQIGIDTIGQMFFRGVQVDPTDGAGWRRILSSDDISSKEKLAALGMSEVVINPQGSLPFLNLMNDSGRFCGKVDPFAYLATNAFANNALFSPYNGGSWSEGGKYIYDNTTSGGTRGAINATVQALMVAMGRGPIGANTRYGVEFYVGKYTAGTGTATPYTSAGGVAHYLTTINGSRVLFCAASWGTFTSWVRVTSGSITCSYPIYVNGEWKPAGTALTASLGWFHWRGVTKSVAGYNNAFPNIYATPGATFEMALPAFFPGAVDMGMHTSPLMTMNELAGA